MSKTEDMQQNINDAEQTKANTKEANVDEKKAAKGTNANGNANENANENEKATESVLENANNDGVKAETYAKGKKHKVDAKDGKASKTDLKGDIKAIKKLNETLLKHEVELEEQVEKLTAEKDSNYEMYLRSVAEFDNFKKRTAKEKAAIYTDATADVIEKFLPLIDNFERAMQSFDAAEDSSTGSFKEGMNLLFKQIEDIFKKAGVEEIEAEGVEFDPNIHNAVMHVEDDAYGENCVAQVLLKGYRIGDKVIRTSMVKVAN